MSSNSLRKSYSEWVQSRTKFELDKSKFAQVRQFIANFPKIWSIKKSRRFNQFLRNSIPEVLYRYVIFVCSFMMRAQILQKLELTDIKKKKNSLKSQMAHQFSWKLSQIKLRECFIGLPYFNSIIQAVYKVENMKIEYVQIHCRAPAKDRISRSIAYNG